MVFSANIWVISTQNWRILIISHILLNNWYWKIFRCTRPNFVPNSSQDFRSTLRGGANVGEFSWFCNNFFKITSICPQKEKVELWLLWPPYIYCFGWWCWNGLSTPPSCVPKWVLLWKWQVFFSDECKEVTVTEIVYVEVRKRDITIVTDTGIYPQNKIFSEFEKLLPPGSYLRISRQVVVMYNHIIRYTPQYVYLMHQGKEVCLTYRHSSTYNVWESLQSWDPNKYLQS